MTDPLYSERAGRPRKISWSDFVELTWRYWVGVRDQLGLLAESTFGYWDLEGDFHPPRHPDPEAAFTTQLKVGGLASPTIHSENRPYDLISRENLLFDLLELLHRDWVSLPGSIEHPDPASFFAGGRDTGTKFHGPIHQAAGQKAFRDPVNPALRLADPPLEMGIDGLIHERPPDELSTLVDAPIPSAEEREVREPIEDAIELYYRRGATMADRLAAVRSLAAVLEHLRPQIKAEALSADERALFDLANNFGIRHHGRGQKVDYNRGAWLEWTFYVYLATARVMVRLRAEQRGDWPPPSGSTTDDDIPF